jgi:hypothetical protein
MSFRPARGLARLVLGRSRRARRRRARLAESAEPMVNRKPVYPKNPVDGVGLFVKFRARLTDLEQQA